MPGPFTRPGTPLHGLLAPCLLMDKSPGGPRISGGPAHGHAPVRIDRRVALNRASSTASATTRVTTPHGTGGILVCAFAASTTRAAAGRPLRREILTTAAILCTLVAGPARAEDPRALGDLSLQQLGDIQVTSVLKRAERWTDAAASIYVITAEDIRRSGATSLPEALRLAPNLEVARADAVQYAITARGFNSVLENKLLVMIDGRVVYSPLFSGVFWEAQGIALPNIERIEVVSGPGGTLWGTNAVNGVINIITRSARQEQGGLLGAGGGNTDRVATFRHGGALGSAGGYRIHGNLAAREHTERADGTAVADAATNQLGEFRADWGEGVDEFMLEGDAFRGDIDQGASKRRIIGLDMLGRWVRERDQNSSQRLQAYIDHTERDQPGAIRERLNTFDLEYQKGLRPFERHDVLWGAGYRLQSDHVENLSVPALAFIPADRELHFGNLFVQDNVSLAPRLGLIAGLKLERNDYTKFEYLPTVRLSWKPTKDRLLWAAASRAIRAPSRIDRELYIPGATPHAALDGGPRFESEIANVVELGYRTQSSAALSYSITGFHHRNDRLRSLEPTSQGPVFGNTLEGTNTGVEAWGGYRVIERWRLSAGVVQQRQIRRRSSGSSDLLGVASLGNDPTQWWTFRSSLDLGAAVQLDIMLREVGGLPSPNVPSYTAVDARLGWKLLHGLEVAVSGQNLFAAHHPEWGVGAVRPEFDRAVFGNILWRP